MAGGDVLAAPALGGAGLAVSEPHDVDGRLVPPVEHEDHQHVPHLVTGTHVVQLAWKISFGNFGDVKEERRASDQVHDQHSRQEQLDHIGGEAPGEADPVAGWDHADARHTAEDGHADLLPVVTEIVRVDLSAEHGQDQRQHRHQVNLPPESVTIEGIEDSRNIAAQDAHGDASVVQREPATTGLLRAVARKQVVANRAQHAHLEAEEADSVDDVVLPVRSRGRQHCGQIVHPQREEEQKPQQVAPDVHRLIGQHENTLEAEFGGQVGPVAVSDVGVLLEEGGDLFVGVQSYSLRDEDRPVLVTAQLHVVGGLQQLLRHLQQHFDHLALSKGRHCAKALLLLFTVSSREAKSTRLSVYS